MRQPLGQHFLHDVGIIQSILAAAELAPTETALEIGAGRGVLTEALALRVKSLIAVELDAMLAEGLVRKFTHAPAVTITQADFLGVDLDALFPAPIRPIKILGNLPYSITSPIFEKLLAWPGWLTGVFLVQLEVALRMQSGPGSRAFGILSLAIQLFADVEIIRKVRPGSFTPPPHVMSAVIRLRRRALPRLREADQRAFFDLAHAAFAHRRKTLLNSLALETPQPKNLIEEWLRAQRINPTQRAETLGVEDYARLAGPWAIFRRETNLT